MGLNHNKNESSHDHSNREGLSQTGHVGQDAMRTLYIITLGLRLFVFV
jgi:hypothetical protein